MIVTDALIVIALCLAVLAAIGVRNALSLRDIGVGLERLAQVLEAEGVPERGRARTAAQSAPGAADAAQPAQAGPDETEIAAAIAAAAKTVGRSGGLTGRSR